MTELQCKKCKKIICEDIDRIKDVKTIMCPYCFRQVENPCYDGGENEGGEYIG